ncbi:MAG: glycosyl transferase [Fibrobacteraceae bacterium]|nr:glycosyl transferase [Fibrobacteraceae bacterium]
MIPKLIHYCWFGGKPLPPLAQRCIESWRRYMPDYEIKEWNEKNFDINAIPYTKEAYQQKKYAFVSDYARFWILHNFGGVYFDTDVELIKSIQPILDRGNYMGLEHSIENGLACNPGLGMACNPQNRFCSEMVEMYRHLKFGNSTGGVEKNVVEYTSEKILQKGLVLQNGIMEFEDFFIYPAEYFCPKLHEFGKTKITKNTYSIHHYAASWIPRRIHFLNFLKRIFGEKFVTAMWRFLKSR